VIAKGDPRLVVKESGPAAGEKGYCGVCGAEMIRKAEEHLEVLRAALDGDTAT
jgi:hypothetical protein